MKNRRLVNSILKILLCVVIGAGLSSCHKKSKIQDTAYVGETLEVNKKKKKKEKKKEKHLGELVAEEAVTWIGTPYSYGRSDKGVATDCSGLVVVVFQEVAKIKLPRNSAQQADWCDDLKEKEIEAGDLVFFATGSDKKKVSHVGVMIDRERFVHASGSKGVIISEMTTPYYRRTFIKYGRVPGLR